MKFKYGDRVVVVNNEFYGETKGTVTSYSGSDDGQKFLVLLDAVTDLRWLPETQLEKV